jgi:YD repeat-containing protein
VQVLGVPQEELLVLQAAMVLRAQTVIQEVAAVTEVRGQVELVVNQAVAEHWVLLLVLAAQERLFFTYTGTSTSAVLQDLNYTYDADGNILTRTDNSYSGTGQQVAYAYDNLNRLLSASTTLSNANPYNQIFSYDALGNILTGADGSYSYQGTGNANPDAVTKTALTVGASAPTIAYDNSAIGGNGTPASSLTFAYTTNHNTNGIILVSVNELATTTCATDKVTGVTYNGTPLTDAGSYVGNYGAVGGALKTYYGYTPATSTNNIVVSASASCIARLTAGTELPASSASSAISRGVVLRM